MLNTILGAKKEMSQTFVQGTRVPVTYIKAGPCIVTQIKKQDKDGYWAIQLGFGEKRTKNITKPLQGHLKAAYKDKKTAARFLREVRLDSQPDVKVGDTVSISDIFSVGDVVAVTGTSKGKGFAGVVKRHRFAGGPRTHGQSDRLRASGAIGQGTTPGRVWKGKRMPGRMGTDTVTVKNLKVVSVDPEKSELTLSGSVPGSPGSLLIIRKLAEGKLEDLARETTRQKVVEGKPGGEGEESDKAEAKPQEAEKASSSAGGKSSF